MPVARTGTVSDAAAFARIQVRAWHHAFADLVYPEMTPTVAERTAAWTDLLERGNLASLAIDVAEAVQGFVAFGRAIDDGEPDVGEIRSLYVDPVAQGAGLGGILLDGAQEAMRVAGHAEAVLWTPEGALVREWYERRGWRQDRPSTPDHGVLGLAEVRYRRALAP